jgi:tRNA pseudouridine32 synthase / 23S rRNA pseudouridine746 synthase
MIPRAGWWCSAPSRLLHEDAALIAVDKSAGVPVIPARNEPADACLRAALEAARGERLWVVHRLDRDTSGVVVFARTAEAHRALSLAFEHRRTAKRYLAWTRGRPGAGEGVADVALHPARKGKMRPARPGEPGAMASETVWSVELTAATAVGPVARVAAEPRTGRQHQIRVHLRWLEAPLLVDPLYGRADRVAAGELGAGSPPVERLTLHASSLELPHPDGSRLRLTAPLPPDLAALDDWLASAQRFVG